MIVQVSGCQPVTPGAYGTTTLQVPKGTNGRAGHEAVLLTLASND